MSELLSQSNETYAIYKASFHDIMQIHRLYNSLSEKSKSTYHSKIYGYPNGIIWFLSFGCMFLSNTFFVSIWRKLLPIYIYRHFVAKNPDGDIMGFVHYVLHGKDKGVLRANIGTAVGDRFQGMGIGSALFREMTNYAKGDSVDILFLTVVSDNIPAVSLYKKNGFQVLEKTEKNILKMELDLRSRRV